MTLGSAAAAHLQFMVWCKGCGQRSEPDPAEQAQWYGPATTVPDWGKRLVCSRCGSRNVSFVVSGAWSVSWLSGGDQMSEPRRLWAAGIFPLGTEIFGGMWDNDQFYLTR